MPIRGNKKIGGSIMDPYEELANAIVLQAVSDYRYATKRMRTHPEEAMIHRRRKKEVKRFIRSAWFKELTNLDPVILLKKLKEEARHD